MQEGERAKWCVVYVQGGRCCCSMQQTTIVVFVITILQVGRAARYTTAVHTTALAGKHVQRDCSAQRSVCTPLLFPFIVNAETCR